MRTAYKPWLCRDAHDLDPKFEECRNCGTSAEEIVTGYRPSPHNEIIWESIFRLASHLRGDGQARLST